MVGYGRSVMTADEWRQAGQQFVVPVPPPKKRRWRYLAVGLVAVGVAVAVTAFLAANEGDDTTPIEDALQECDVHERRSASLGDDGRSVSIDGESAGDVSGANVSQIACILGALDVPDAVVSRIDNTRALDGMQDATWDGFEATWTYHPDDGLNIIIVEA